jgi:hypothetical protein
MAGLALHVAAWLGLPDASWLLAWWVTLCCQRQWLIWSLTHHLYLSVDLSTCIDTSERPELPRFDIFEAITNVLVHISYKPIYFIINIYILITKIFRGPVRSHSLHGPTDTPDQVGGLLAIVCSTYYYTSTNDEGHYLWHEAVRAVAPPPSLLYDVAGCCRWGNFYFDFFETIFTNRSWKMFFISKPMQGTFPHPPPSDALDLISLR